MSTQNKGGKPIKITLTEGQISDIITQSASKRRGLKAESLEDRIAPSVIGAPMDPGLAPPPEGGLEDFGEPPVPPPGGDGDLPFDPTLPPGDTVGGPFGGDSITPVDPSDPSSLVFDPLNPEFAGGPPIPPGEMVPPGHPGFQPPGGFIPGHGQGGPLVPPGPGGPFGPPGPGGPFGHGPHVPSGDPGIPGEPQPPSGRPVDRPGQFQPPPGGDPGTPPSPEEMENHRRNILRQLRGGDPGPEIPGEPQP